jgi:hypothetical protein
MQKIYQINQSVRMQCFVEFEKRRKLTACVHNLNLNYLPDFLQELKFIVLFLIQSELH